MKQKITVWIAVLIWLAALSARSDENGSVEINPRDHRAAIRAELLKFTPLGSTAHDVIKFLKTRLAREGDAEPKIEKHPATGPSAEASEKRGVKVIKINLANYLTKSDSFDPGHPAAAKVVTHRAMGLR